MAAPTLTGACGALIDGGRKKYFAAMAGGFPTVHQHGSTCGGRAPLPQLPES